MFKDAISILYLQSLQMRKLGAKEVLWLPQ